MSKDLAPLLAVHDPSQARMSVHRASNGGSIDGWILVLRRYLQHTQSKAFPDDKVCSIFGHLEGALGSAIFEISTFPLVKRNLLRMHHQKSLSKMQLTTLIRI